MDKKIKIKNCDKDRKLNGAIIIYEKMPFKPAKYVTEERLQEVVNGAVASIRKDMVTHDELHQVVNDAVASIRKDMVTHDELQEAVASIRKDMVTEERLHEVVHQVVGEAINGLETRMTKLILSLKN
jgi:transcriptional regulator NrdR family protein